MLGTIVARLNLKVLLVSLLFSIALALYWIAKITNLPIARSIPNDIMYSLHSYVLPVLLFVVAYFLGKKVELPVEYLSVIVSLLIGCLVYPLITIPLLSISIDPSINYFIFYFLPFVFEGLQIFFISFTAIALGSLRSRQVKKTYQNPLV